MGIIKGQNLRIMIDGNFIAFATACTVHVSKQLEDSSTKDNTDSWTAQEVTGKSWDISCDALFSVETSADSINGDAALDLILSDAPVSVIFSQTEGTMNRDQVSGGLVWSGNAIVNDISINASNRQNATYSLQAQGVGPLEKM